MKLSLLLGTLMFTAFTARAQVATINENFESFATTTSAAWPQNGWSKVAPPGAGPFIYAEGTTDKVIQFYSLMAPNTAAYLITPQIVAPDGTKSLTFTYAMSAGSGGTGTLQVGMVSTANTAGTAAFTSISPVYELNSTTEQTVTITVPASANQYIAFKFIGAAQHTALYVDDVIYNASSSLAVSDTKKSEDQIKFALTADHTALQFVSKAEPRNIQIYSATGTKVAEGKLKNQQFDVQTLQTGVYFIIIEENGGKITKSKFIKK
ncbi:T9SS-dependent choice-of-anchor J family protein [Chryseobacterium gwangjuense]|uniref:T9SS-dependent choice-of-anchor J family protein n=1 Tax=Chryseobacterium gwangjuense TaxID=1069980 RepID=UPI001E347C1E|nr:choice-of-anchor J domain-containing protein [Chryseobacterium gwangjuense]MCE3075996.1 choice-of-anchor J domain-containing protein [Chryseobacterium gwangjuense]